MHHAVHTGYETANKYSIRTMNNEKLFFARETTDSCERMCFGKNR